MLLSPALTPTRSSNPAPSSRPRRRHEPDKRAMLSIAIAARTSHSVEMDNTKMTVGLVIFTMILTCPMALARMWGPQMVRVTDVGAGDCLSVAPTSLSAEAVVVDCAEGHPAQVVAVLIVPAMSINTPKAEVEAVIVKIAAQCPDHLNNKFRQLVAEGRARLYDIRPSAGASHLICLVAAISGELVGSAV